MTDRVYVFDTGKCFHRRYRCSAVMWFHWDGRERSVGLYGAQSAGYTPCSRCCPDEHRQRTAASPSQTEAGS